MLPMPKLLTEELVDSRIDHALRTARMNSAAATPRASSATVLTFAMRAAFSRSPRYSLTSTDIASLSPAAAAATIFLSVSISTISHLRGEAGFPFPMY